MEQKSLSDRLKDDVLSDNTHITYCETCKDCAFWSEDGSPYANAYDKAYCDQFPFPAHKPVEVINSTGKCPVKVKRHG